jgi:hypothetical protein
MAVRTPKSSSETPNGPRIGGVIALEADEPQQITDM